MSSPGGRPGAVGLAPVPDVGAEGALAQHQGRAGQELAGGRGGRRGGVFLVLGAHQRLQARTRVDVQRLRRILRV